MHRKGRTALFVVSIAFGMAMVTSMRLSTQGAIANFSAELARQSGRAALQVTFGTGESGFPEEFVDVIREQDFVADAAAMVRGSLTLVGGERETLELFGVDVLQPTVLDIYDAVVVTREQDDFTIINDPHGVFLTESFAKSHDLRLGSKILLTSTQGTEQYTVRGIIAAGGLADAFGGAIAVMYLPAAQHVTGKRDGPIKSNVDQIDVVLKEGVGVAEAQRRLREILPSQLEVQAPAQRRLTYERAVSGLAATLQGISWFVMLAALFVVYSSTTALVSSRLPAMATLLMVGVRATSLSRLVVIESGLLGAFGSVVGAGLGSVMAMFVIRDIQGGMSLNYWLDFAGGGPSFDPVVLLVVQPAIGALVAMASAYGPARRLLDTDPLEVKRSQADAEASRGFRYGAAWAAGAVLLALGSVAIAHGVRTNTPATASFGCLIAIFGTLIVVLPLVPLLWAIVRIPLVRWFGTAGRIAAANLGRNLDRSVVLVGGIALCGAVAVGAATLPTSFRTSSGSWYGFANDAIVSSRTLKGGWLNEPVSGDILPQLESLPSTASVDLIRVAQGQVFRGDRVAVVALSDGMLRSAISGATSIDADSDDVLEAVSAGQGFIVSNNFARRYKVDVGDALDIPSPAGLMSRQVRAIVPDYVSDRGSILLGIDTYRENWNDRLVTFFSIDLELGSTVLDLNRDVSKALGAAHPLLVMSSAGLRQRTDDAIALAFADVDAIQLLLVLVTLVGIVDFLVTTIMDRRREMNLINAIGATSKLIRRSVALEAGVIGATAGVIGACVGIAFSWVWITYTYPVLVGYVLTLNVSLPTAILCVVAATAVAAIAGAFAVTGVIRSSIAEGAHAE